MGKQAVNRQDIKKEVDNNFGVVLRRMKTEGINIAGFTPATTIEYLFKLSVTGHDISKLIPTVNFQDEMTVRNNISNAVNANYNGVKNALYNAGYHIGGQDPNVIQQTLFELYSTGTDITPFIGFNGIVQTDESDNIFEMHNHMMRAVAKINQNKKRRNIFNF